MKKRTKLIIAGGAIAAVLAGNYAPTVVGAEPIITLESLYMMVTQQGAEIENIKQQLETNKANSLDALEKTPEPTATPEPFSFSMANDYPVGPRSFGNEKMKASITNATFDLIPSSDGTCTLKLYIDGKFEIFQPDQVKNESMYFNVYVQTHDNSPVFRVYKKENVIPPSNDFANFIVEIPNIEQGSYGIDISPMISFN